MTQEELIKSTQLGLITFQEALDYLGIDYVDDMICRNIKRVYSVAVDYVRGAVTPNITNGNPKLKELILIVMSDLYENRGLTSTVSQNTRRLVEDISLQLRLEAVGK